MRYRASSAQTKARFRRRCAKKDTKKLQENLELRTYVIAGLQRGWSPTEISGRMREEERHFYASKTTIYDWLYSAWGQQYCSLLPSKHYKPKKRRRKNTKRVMIPARIPLCARPTGADTRTRYGHWEIDAVVSGRRTGGKAALIVAIERKSRLVDARLVPYLTPNAVSAALQHLLDNKKALSVTMDNGQENRHHLDLRKKGIQTFFCDPYSPWQKGSVEQINGMLRRYIPKGCDLATFSQEEIDHIIARINAKPRKILGFATAIEAAVKGHVILDPSTTTNTSGGALGG